MGLLREALYGAAKAAENVSSEWVTVESTENAGHSTELITFKAKKIHTRASAVYETTVEIRDNQDITVKNRQGDFHFTVSDIAAIEQKLTFIFSIFYIILCAAVGVIMLMAMVLIPVALLLFAIPFYTALIKTIKIRLKDGRVVKIYYNVKSDAEVLLSRLRAAE